MLAVGGNKSLVMEKEEKEKIKNFEYFLLMYYKFLFHNLFKIYRFPIKLYVIFTCSWNYDIIQRI